MFRQLMEAERRCLSLAMENAALRKNGPAPQTVPPTAAEVAAKSPSSHGEETAPEEIRQRIDTLMSELTGLMDKLDGKAASGAAGRRKR